MSRLPIPLIPRWLRWAGVGAIASVIVYFSLVTTVPGPLGETDPLWDKKLHFAAYGGFALALAYATVEWKGRKMLRTGGVLGTALVFGLAIELGQGMLPLRYYSNLDLLANLIGASLVVPWFILESRVRYFSPRGK